MTPRPAFGQQLAALQQDLFNNDTRLKTPGGLYVPPDSYESLVKSAARDIAKKERGSQASLFSAMAVVHNLSMYGARQKPLGTPSHDILYECAQKSFIDAMIIKARCDQAKQIFQPVSEGADANVGYKVVHDRNDDPNFEITDSIKRRCREMEALIAHPTPYDLREYFPHQVPIHDTLEDLIVRLVQAELIIDRQVLQLYPRRDGRGVAAFHWLPGSSIYMMDVELERWMKKNGESNPVRAKERMSELYDVDLTHADYVQIIDERLMDAFTVNLQTAVDHTVGLIAVHITNPSDALNRFGYGTSALEMSLDVTAAWLLSWRYNKDLFKTNYPEAVMSLRGDYSKESLEAFKRQLYGEAGGAGVNWRLPVISGEDIDLSEKAMEIVKLRDSPREMMFADLLRFSIALKAAGYGADPSICNFSPDNAGRNAMFGENRGDEIADSKERGLKPLISDKCAFLTRAIVKPRYADLRVAVVGLDSKDETKQISIDVQRVSSYQTVDELRATKRLPPLLDAINAARKAAGEKPLTNDEINGNYINNGLYLQYLSTLQQAAQAKLQQEQGYDFGQEDEATYGQSGGNGKEGEQGQGQPDEGETQSSARGDVEGKGGPPQAAPQQIAPQPMTKAQRESAILRLAIE